MGLKTSGKVLDHIIRVSGPSDPQFFAVQNLQLLCSPCHDGKRARESHEPFEYEPAPPKTEGEASWG